MKLPKASMTRVAVVAIVLLVTILTSMTTAEPAAARSFFQWVYDGICGFMEGVYGGYVNC